MWFLRHVEDLRWRLAVPEPRPTVLTVVACHELYRGNQDAPEYCRRRDLSITAFELWTRHLVSADDLRKRAEKLQNLHRKKAARSRKKVPPKRPKRPLATAGAPTAALVALRSFWSMHVKAMNWSGMGHAEYAAALGLSPHTLQIWRNRLEESGDEMDWRSLLHPSARPN